MAHDSRWFTLSLDKQDCEIWPKEIVESQICTFKKKQHNLGHTTQTFNPSSRTCIQFVASYYDRHVYVPGSMPPRMSLPCASVSAVCCKFLTRGLMMMHRSTAVKQIASSLPSALTDQLWSCSKVYPLPAAWSKISLKC